MRRPTAPIPTMILTASQWHQRFQQQAAWTESIRSYLLGRLDLNPGSHILEVGCGTGVITSLLNGYTQATAFGLDLNREFLSLAAAASPSNRFLCGDALQIPFPSAAFDAVVCHFFLLWVPRPEGALAEMKRTLRSGGALVAFAEPDYGGRIDYPPQFSEIGQQQADALRRQGADPEMGRKLSGLFHATGLHAVETGLLGGQWKNPPSPKALALEWDVLESDLGGQIPASHLDKLRLEDITAWQTGQRVLFVPTFYAIGWK